MWKLFYSQNFWHENDGSHPFRLLLICNTNSRNLKYSFHRSTYNGSMGSLCFENVSSPTLRCCLKKVGYLFNDCNIVHTILYKVFAVVSNHTLPEDEMQTPLYTITMPSAFDLDAPNLWIITWRVYYSYIPKSYCTGIMLLYILMRIQHLVLSALLPPDFDARPI